MKVDAVVWDMAVIQRSSIIQSYSVFYGPTKAAAAKNLLHYANSYGYIDRETILYGKTLASWCLDSSTVVPAWAAATASRLLLEEGWVGAEILTQSMVANILAFHQPDNLQDIQFTTETALRILHDLLHAKEFSA